MGLNIIKLQERSSGNKGEHTVFQMSIPKWVVEKLGWERGDTLSIKTGWKCMKVKKLEVLDV